MLIKIKGIRGSRLLMGTAPLCKHCRRVMLALVEGYIQIFFEKFKNVLS